MSHYMLQTDDGQFLHEECGMILQWHNINSDALCTFDSINEAQEFIDDNCLTNVNIID